MLQTQQTELLGKLARRRIEAIGEVRKLVWGALCLLFNNGDALQSSSDSVKDRASRYALAIERTEDPRFFDDLAREIEATDPEAEYLDWLVGLAERSEKVLRDAFLAGPRSGMQRYRAQSAALNRFHGVLRSENSPLPMLSRHFRQLANRIEGNNSQSETFHG
jgi:CRISPR system Cascade subunit CasA